MTAYNEDDTANSTRSGHSVSEFMTVKFSGQGLEFCSLRSEICLVENINTENKRGRGITISTPRRTMVAEMVEEQRSAE